MKPKLCVSNGFVTRFLRAENNPLSETSAVLVERLDQGILYPQSCDEINVVEGQPTERGEAFR
jgi:hypothetical protein